MDFALGASWFVVLVPILMSASRWFVPKWTSHLPRSAWCASIAISVGAIIDILKRNHADLAYQDVFWVIEIALIAYAFLLYRNEKKQRDV
jgi:hypothetical protein